MALLPPPVFFGLVSPGTDLSCSWLLLGWPGAGRMSCPQPVILISSPFLRTSSTFHYAY